MTETLAKSRVRSQFAAAGDAYVRSVTHATGSDLQRMVELATPQPHERLLDLATGGGHVARTFSPHVAEVTASDLTPEILAHAEEYLTGLELANIELAQVDAEAIPYSDASFDLVTCRIAPHHFPHPDRFVRESARVLRPGGRFVLVDTTVPEGDAGEFCNAFDKRRDPSHVRSLTVEEWLDLIAAAGLTATHVESFPRRHDFADWTSRVRMTDADRAELERMMLDASPDMQERCAAEIVDGRLVAITDTKSLFVACKPEGTPNA